MNSKKLLSLVALGTFLVSSTAVLAQSTLVVWQESVTQGIMNVVNWGMGIILLMIVYQIFQILGHHESKTATGGKIAGWMSKAKRGVKGTDEHKERQSERAAKTGLLNQYVNDKKELERLEITEALTKQFEDHLLDVEGSGFRTAGKKKEIHDKYYDSIEKQFHKSEEMIRKLKRSTFRAERGLRRFEHELESEQGKERFDDSGNVAEPFKGLNDHFEKQVMVKHQEVINHINAAKTALNKLKGMTSKLKSGSSYALTSTISGKTVLQYLQDIKAQTTVFKNHVVAAIKAQDEAYKFTEGLIAKMRKAWD